MKHVYLLESQAVPKQFTTPTAVPSPSTRNCSPKPRSTRGLVAFPYRSSSSRHCAT